MVIIGMVLYLLLPSGWSSEVISSILLYILIFLVGIDLSTIRIQSLTINHFKVPLVTNPFIICCGLCSKVYFR